MPAEIDIERLQKIFTRRGERVVIVVPGQEPLVLVPLNEYEQMSAVKKGGNRPTEPKGGKPEARSISAAKPEAPEQIDPLQGGLSDDDQYFPEPL